MSQLSSQSAAPRYVISRNGIVHEYQCEALTHDGPCQCPLVLNITHPRKRRKEIT